MNLTEAQYQRYNRQIILNEIGPGGQQKILASRVLVVDAGGLGSPVLLYLAAAGVGTIGIIDYDTVDVSNLQRQVIHSSSVIGTSKVISARDRIHDLNPDCTVISHPLKLTPVNALDIIRDYDFVVEATDTYASKFLVNDACVIGKKPFSQGGVYQFDGQTFTYEPGTTCYRCLYNAPPPPAHDNSSSPVGILGSVAGIIGAIQATEVIKYITATGDILVNRLLTFNALTMQVKTITTQPDPLCPACGVNARKDLLHQINT